jgi:hypothetical protein
MMHQIISVSIRQFFDFRPTLIKMCKIALMLLSLTALSIIVSLILFQSVVSSNYVRVDNILGIEAILSLSIKAYSILFLYSIITIAGYILAFVIVKILVLIKSGSVKFFKHYLFNKRIDD